MAVTVAGTSITFNDGTVQTTAGGTAASGAVGSILVLFCSSSTARLPGATISGSYMFLQTAGTNPRPIFGDMNDSGQSFSWNNRTTAVTYAGGGGATFTPQAGTWRFLSYGAAVSSGCNNTVYATLAVRIA